MNTSEKSIIQPEIIEVLREASATLVGTFDLESLLQRVVESYRQISNASVCSIFLIDEKENELVMRANAGYAENLNSVAKYDLSVNTDTLGIGLTAWIALTKKKFSAKNRKELANHPAWMGKFDGQQYIGDKDCNSFIGVPLIIRDKVIGVLKAENKISNALHPESFFSPEEEQVFEILANTATIAIEYLLLIEELRKNQNQEIIDSIHEIFSKVLGIFELDQILRIIVESFKNISNATACAIFLVDDNELYIRMRESVGYENDLKRTAEYDLSVNPDTPAIGLTAWIALTKQKFSAKTHDELTRHPAWIGKYEGQQYTGDEECKSFIGVPLIIRDRTIGVLKAENKIPDALHPESFFTPKEEQLFEILSNIAAIVVTNARLITRQESQLESIISLYRIGAMLQEQDNFDRLIYIFLTGLTHGKVIGFNRAIFFEYQPVTKRLIGRMSIGPRDKQEGELIRQKMEKDDPLSLEACIHAFDDNKKALKTQLNQLVLDTIIDLEKGDIFLQWVKENKKVFKSLKNRHFSGDFKEFLDTIGAENVILIGIAPSKKNYSFILCDNIYSHKSFDQSTSELLGVFIEQIARALERIQSIENVRAAKVAALKQASAMAAHRLGNILPFTEKRITEALEMSCGNTDLENLLKPCYEHIKEGMVVLQKFLEYAEGGKINPTKLENINNILNIIEQSIKNLKADFSDIKIMVNFFDTEKLPYIRIDMDSIKNAFHNLAINTINANPNDPEIKIWADYSSDFELNKHNLWPNGNFIKIVYEDNGPGIPFEKKKKYLRHFIHLNQGILD
ncbi:MAG: GAF domain-containing sensor histidine kinase [bacterium]|nr:GAF domain-containing sensor histidine kinase [bacterium]